MNEASGFAGSSSGLGVSKEDGRKELAYGIDRERVVCISTEDTGLRMDTRDLEFGRREIRTQDTAMPFGNHTCIHGDGMAATCPPPSSSDTHQSLGLG